MLLDEIGTYLQTQGVGTLAVDLFLGRMPATPDTAMSVMEYGGLAPVKAMSATPGAAVLEMPSIQVLSRSANYTTARTRAESAYKKLDGFSGVLSGVRYGFISANQAPFFIQRDENDRVWIGFNCLVSKALSP